jgi:hypothetical protein
MLYIIMSSLEDEATQRKGIVLVFYRFGLNMINPPDSKLFMKSLRLLNGLPFRIRGWHYCTNDRLFSMLFPFASRHFEKEARVRCRVHFGAFWAGFGLL